MTGTSEIEGSSSKVESFFVWESAKKYVQLVWAESRGVPREEVSTKDEEGGGDTKTSRARDKRC